jgi:hypothetical protein
VITAPATKEATDGAVEQGGPAPSAWLSSLILLQALALGAFT